MKLKQCCWECSGTGEVYLGFERQVCGDCSGTGWMEVDVGQDLVDYLAGARDLDELCTRLALAAGEREADAEVQRDAGNDHEADCLALEAWVFLCVREALSRFVVVASVGTHP